MEPAEAKPAFVLSTSRRINNATHGSDLTFNNFYGSWEDGLLSQTPYTTPTDVWRRLKQHGRLFYRLHVADTASWENYAVTTSDMQANSAPSFQIAAIGVSTEEDTDSDSSGGSSSLRTVTFPSGAIFNVVDSPTDGVDYSDPVGNGAVPLIEVKGRMEEKLSRNFKVKELAARDRANYARISTDLVAGLQRIRDRVGSSVTVRSGYRHLALNESVDDSGQSQHLAGRAAEIRARSVSPLELAAIAIEELGCNIGIGLDKSSIHIDLRGQLASWRYRGAALTDSEFDQWVQDMCSQAGRRSLAKRKLKRELSAES